MAAEVLDFVEESDEDDGLESELLDEESEPDEAPSEEVDEELSLFSRARLRVP